jgi:hypothetical protein
MSGSENVRDAIAELMNNLGTIGVFMLGEARSFLRKSWGASREQFFAAVDQTARTMKQSGKLAADDIERSAERVKQAWELLDREKTVDWDNFLAEVKTRLGTMADVSRETFDLCINQAKEVLDKQWEATGRLGEEQLKMVAHVSEQMAEAVKSQWGIVWDYMEKSGKKVDRAVDAAWDELKKKD